MKTEAEKRADLKYRLKHRTPDSYYLKERRENYDSIKWKEIPGFPGYEISIEGEVYFKGDVSKRLRRRSMICVQNKNKLGYKTVAINIGGVKNRYYVHRLMGITFLENKENKKEIDHIDGDPSNNRLENLRWATHKENLNNEISVQREIQGHLGLPSNIKGRKKVWVDKEKKIYKMI